MNKAVNDYTALKNILEKEMDASELSEIIDDVIFRYSMYCLKDNECEGETAALNIFHLNRLTKALKAVSAA